MSYGGRCTYCGREVEAEHGCYRVTGYEQARVGGGANKIIGRDRLPGWIAHPTCLSAALLRERQGITEDQGGLF